MVEQASYSAQHHKSDKNKTVLFSGRFDRPNCGHIRTIQLLAQRFKKVLVVVLDHKEQMYPACYRAQILREIFENCKGEYEVVINDQHFAKIEVDDLLKFQFDVYGAGNVEVLEHIERLRNGCLSTTPEKSIPGGTLERGRRHFDIIWVDRPYDYDSSTERLGRQVEKMQR